MGTDSYLSRVKRAGQAVQERLEAELPRAKELLEKSSSVSAAIATKAAQAISEGTAKAKEEVKAVGSRVVEAGQVANRLVTDKGSQIKGFVRRTPSSSAESEGAPETEHKTALAIKKLSGKDKIGLAGEGLAAIGGAAAGVAASGAVASAAGATTLLGSTTLASVLGGVFVTATPIGWVIGSAVVAGTAGYGVARMIRSGGRQDQVRADAVRRLSCRLATLQSNRKNANCMVELDRVLRLILAAGAMTDATASRMVTLVEEGALEAGLALERVRSIALAKGLIATD